MPACTPLLLLAASWLPPAQEDQVSHSLRQDIHVLMEGVFGLLGKLVVACLIAAGSIYSRNAGKLTGSLARSGARSSL